MTEETVLTPASGGESGGSEPSYMSEMLSSAGDSLSNMYGPEQPAASTSGEGETQPQPETPAATATEDAQLTALANELGADLSDPGVRKIIENLVTSGRLQTKQEPSTSESLDPSPLAEEELTEFERSLFAPPTEEPVPGQPTQPAATTPETPAESQPVDIGASWQKPEDAYEAQSSAWDERDLSKVHQIDTAMFVRRAEAIMPPLIQRVVESYLQQHGLLEVLPAIRADHQQRQFQSNVSSAREELSKLKGYESVNEMFDRSEGKITFRGAEYDNTAYNRTIAKYPELLNIRVEHANPQLAEKATLIARYRAAYRLARIESAKPSAAPTPQPNAKDLLRAGQQMQEREQQDRFRQALNAGSGATGLPQGEGKGSSYVRELVNSSAGELSLNDLFR